MPSGSSTLFHINKKLKDGFGPTCIYAVEKYIGLQHILTLFCGTMNNGRSLVWLFFGSLFLAPTVPLCAVAGQQQAKPTASQPSRFSGTIRDGQTKKPLAGASVHLTDLMTGAVSNSEGFFQVRNIPPGRHFVEISYVGYASISFSIEANGDLSQDYALTPSILEGNEVVVTGVSMATEIRRSPVPLSLIKQQELSRAIDRKSTRLNSSH